MIRSTSGGIGAVRFLQDSDMQKIHEQAIYLLENTGIGIEHQAGMEMLENAGAAVDYDKKTACFSASLVEKCLASVPRKITLAGRNPERDLILEPNGTMRTRNTGGMTQIHDLETGDIDVALLWGPIAGFYAKKSPSRLNVTPLPEASGARMAFRIAFGVRHSDQNWKRELNTLIAQNKGEIEKILVDYGVPLLDESGQPLVKP